jgi:hypothetical protein
MISAAGISSFILCQNLVLSLSLLIVFVVAMLTLVMLFMIYRAWQSCIDYQEQNQLLDSGLPAWAEQRNITLRPHLSKAVPYCQLDLVDRCYMQRKDEDNAAAGRGSSGSGGGGPDGVGFARLADACGSGYAAAGAEQLLPLRVGSYEQFVAPCSCPKVRKLEAESERFDQVSSTA